MAQEQIVFRANIQTSVFPLLSQLSAQTIIVPQQDQTYVRNVNPSDSVAPTDYGIPQIFYGHNIMPSTYGFQSVAYLDLYPAIYEGAALDNAYLVLSTEKVRTYVAVDYKDSSQLWFLSQAGIWQSPEGNVFDLTEVNRVSVATVNGSTFICVAQRGVYKYTIATNTLSKQVLQGLDNSGIYSIVATNGYLIAVSKTGIAWSSVNDPLDFTPSDISGAGGGEVQEAEGEIVFAQKTAYGFIIYTTNNAVSAAYSGNSTFPFNFKAISAAGGIANSDMVCREGLGTQYAYTTNGLQQVYHTGGKTVLPAVTDFLAGQIFEDFDEATNKLLISYFTTTMRKKLTLVSDRYLVLSYGMDLNAEMTHALVIDIIQSRMGKLKIKHNAAFEIRNIAPESVETPRRSIAFLQGSGAVKVVDFNTGNTAGRGVLMLGKYQLLRSNDTSLQGVTLENVPDADLIEVLDMLSYDGKNFQRVEEMVLDETNSTGLIKTYCCDVESKNHSLLIKGYFNLIAPILTFKLGGDN